MPESSNFVQFNMEYRQLIQVPINHVQLILLVNIFIVK